MRKQFIKCCVDCENYGGMKPKDIYFIADYCDKKQEHLSDIKGCADSCEDYKDVYGMVR